MRVSKDATHSFAVQHLVDRRGICLFASRSKLLLTKPAFTARNHKAIDNAISNLPLLDCRTDLLYHTAELVTEDVTLLCLDNYAVQNVHVTSADSRACNLDDNVVVLEEFGLANLLWEAVLVARLQRKLMDIHTNTYIILAHPY